jgi:peroxiredoxin
MRAIFLTFLFVLSISSLEAQEVQDLDTYSNIELKSGFPTLSSGKQVNLDYDNPQYGSIDPGEAFSGVYILVDNSEPNSPRIRYLLEKKDRTISLGSLPFEDHQAKIQYAKMNFLPNEKAQYTYPVEVIYHADSNQYFYKWLGSQESNRPKAVKNTSKLKEGSQIPEFSVPLLNGESFNLEEEKNKILVINWWSTSCSPCIAEIPGFNKLVDKYKSNNEIVFLAIAWDTEKRIKNFLAENEFAYKHRLYNDQTVKLFGGVFPRNLVIDRNGKIAYNELGANENQWVKLDQVLQLVASISKE